jgi:hypothetical protein
MQAPIFSKKWRGWATAAVQVLDPSGRPVEFTFAQFTYAPLQSLPRVREQCALDNARRIRGDVLALIRCNGTGLAEVAQGLGVAELEASAIVFLPILS